MCRWPFYQVQWPQFEEAMSDRSRSARPEPGLFAASTNEAFRLKINGLRPAWCAGSRVAEYASRHQ
jgi:hypothetical protein